MKGHQSKAYELFQKHEKLTDVQLQRLLAINPNSVRPLRLNLEKQGLIRRMKAKKKHTRGRSSNNHDGMHTIYKIVRNPIEIKRATGLEANLDNLIKRVEQLNKALILLKAKIVRKLKNR